MNIENDDFTKEFATVDYLLASNFETRGVDAFAISLIKTERQLRKIFTYLIYQLPCFDYKDVDSLRNTLSDNKRVYFEGLINGFDELYPKKISELFGDGYTSHLQKVKNASDYRDKIFHGQLTKKKLSRNDLETTIKDLKVWCKQISIVMEKEINYSGFGRNSFRKSSNDLSSNYKCQIQNIKEYENYIEVNMDQNSIKKKVSHKK